VLVASSLGHTRLRGAQNPSRSASSPAPPGGGDRSAQRLGEVIVVAGDHLVCEPAETGALAQPPAGPRSAWRTRLSFCWKSLNRPHLAG
jgi:hypothetical protein